MKKFKQYLIEATTGVGAWEKYFKDKEVVTTVKKTSIIYDFNGKKTDDVLEIGAEILVPSSSSFQNGKIQVIYKGKPVSITFSTITKPATTGGEQLKIPAAKLIQVAMGKTVTVGSKTFPAKVFYNSTDLATAIQNGLQLIKTVPEDLKSILMKYLSKGRYKTIDWQGYDNKGLKNEVAKYLGELIIGLCVMNGEKVLTGSNPFSGKKIKEFIVPTDSSFAGVDSMFTTHKGESIPISSKSGSGAPASFKENVMPVLLKGEIPITSPLLKFMTNILKSNNMKNMEWLYYIGMNYIMEKYLKGNLGNAIKKQPYSIYNNLIKNNIGEKEEYVLSIVSDPKIKWPVMKNHKNIISKLPNSLTYFICQNIAELLNNDKSALNTIIAALSSKNFYQANLNQSKFLNGEVSFNIVGSGSKNIKIMQGKGSMGSIKSEQGRLSYMIK